VQLPGALHVHGSGSGRARCTASAPLPRPLGQRLRASRAEQSRAEQSRAEQSRAEKEEQSRHASTSRLAAARAAGDRPCHGTVVARRHLPPLAPHGIFLATPAWTPTRRRPSERGRCRGSRAAPEPPCRLASLSRADGPMKRVRRRRCRETRQALWHAASLAAISHCGREPTVSRCVLRPLPMRLSTAQLPEGMP
jgi:hypothetical protein